MQLTSVEKNRCTPAMKAMALSLMPHIKWRHHGIGVLQGYIVEDNAVEVRLHVWHQSLLKPGMEFSGDIHDHRFDLVSHVLTGIVGHEEILPEPCEGGEWSMMSLTHARAAKETGYHGPTTPIAGEYRVGRNAFAIAAGHTYRFPAGRFHRSPLLGHGQVTVTVVEKHNQRDAPARILFPTARPPVMAFGHDMDWSIIGPVLAQAQAALLT